MHYNKSTALLIVCGHACGFGIAFSKVCFVLFVWPFHWFLRCLFRILVRDIENINCLLLWSLFLTEAMAGRMLGWNVQDNKWQPLRALLSCTKEGGVCVSGYCSRTYGPHLRQSNLYGDMLFKYFTDQLQWLLHRVITDMCIVQYQ